MGVGKTWTSLCSAMEYLIKYHLDTIFVLLKTSLWSTWQQEIDFVQKVYSKYSYIKIITIAYNSDTEMNNFVRLYKKFNWCVVIVEEAHNFINGVFNWSIVPLFFYKWLTKSNQCKFILLSGTPIIQNGNELALLINLCKGTTLFDTTKGAIEHYNDTIVATRSFGIVVWSDGDLTNYPRLEPSITELCEFNEDENNNQWVILASINKTSVDYISVRDTCLLTITFCEDKLNKIIQNIWSNLEYKHIIYSNYTASVIAGLCEWLTNEKIGFVTIIGDISFDQWKTV